MMKSPSRFPASPTTMIGRRLPKRVVNLSDSVPTDGGTITARTPPEASTTPIPIATWLAGTNAATCA